MKRTAKNENHNIKKRFIACCFTPYHAINAAYYAHELKSKNVETVIIWNYSSSKFNIDLLEHSFDKIIKTNDLSQKGLLNRQIYQILEYGWGYAFSSMGKMIRQNNSDSLLAIFSDQEALTARTMTYYKKYHKGPIVLIDEGIGLYTIQDNFTSNIKSATRIKMLLTGIKSHRYIGASKDIDVLIAQYPDLLPHEKIYERSIIKQSKIDLDFLTENGSLSNIAGMRRLFKKINQYKFVICYLGQPTHEIGVREQYDNEIIKYISDAINDETLLVIKPHPRDKNDKYQSVGIRDNVYLIENQLAQFPVESFSKIINCKCYISTTSSAGIQMVRNNSQSYGIFTYKILKEFFGKETDNIISSLGNQALTPKDMVELIAYVKEIEDKVVYEYTESINEIELKEDIEALYNYFQI